MTSPSLRSATASEPLTLDEEYAMQRSWRNDADKLTFIICLPLPDAEGVMSIKADEFDGEERMVGDVNLFLFTNDEDVSEYASPSVSTGLVGELELMIALPSLRRKGYGRAALSTFVAYILRNWTEIAREYASFIREQAEKAENGDVPNLDYLRVKINEQNTGSIALFQILGFEPQNEGRANYFGEVELRWYSVQENVTVFGAHQKPRMLEYRD